MDVAQDLPDVLLGQTTEVSNGPSSLIISSSPANQSSGVQPQTLASGNSGLQSSLLPVHVPSPQINAMSHIIQNDKTAIHSPNNSGLGSPHQVRQQPQTPSSSTMVPMQPSGIAVSSTNSMRNLSGSKNQNIGLKSPRLQSPAVINNSPINPNLPQSVMISQPNHMAGINAPQNMNKPRVPFQAQVMNRTSMQHGQPGVPTVPNPMGYSNSGVRGSGVVVRVKK